MLSINMSSDIKLIKVDLVQSHFISDGPRMICHIPCSLSANTFELNSVEASRNTSFMYENRTIMVNRI